MVGGSSSRLVAWDDMVARAFDFSHFGTKEIGDELRAVSSRLMSIVLLPFQISSVGSTEKLSSVPRGLDQAFGMVSS